MKTTLLRPCTALRLFAGLFFLFITAAATASPPTSSDWADNVAGSIVNDGGGDGKSIEKPILIASAAELAYFAKQVNAGGTTLDCGGGEGISGNAGGFTGCYFALSADIALEGKKWEPIGTADKPFKGHFDGKGYEVKGLMVKIDNNSSYVYAGLFGSVKGGTLQNLGVELSNAGIEISAASDQYTISVGGIAGYISPGTLRNCYVEGEGAIRITGKTAANVVYAGGIAGEVYANDFTHCYATVGVEVEVSKFCCAGGIVGFMEGFLSYTYATGKVTATGGTEDQYVGGICGHFADRSGILSHNLALNTSVNASASEAEMHIHRIVGYVASSTGLSLESNYASRDVKLNGQTASGTTDTSEDGADTSLDHFEDDLKNGPNNAWSDAWVFEDDNLPQLKMAVGDKNDTPTFEDWPDGKQTPRPASDYLSLVTATSIANLGDGDGTSIDSPILIASAEELAYFAQQVNAGGTTLAHNGTALSNTGGFTGCYFALSADIALKGERWEPIGNAGSNSFNGHFDGRGHKVSGLKVKIENTSLGVVYAGLFGFVDSGTLQNLGVELSDAGIEVSSTLGDIFLGYAGGIVGSIFGGTLRNCYVEGRGAIKVTAEGVSNAYSGGIAGYANNLITHCYATVDVEAKATGDCYAGGIAGQMHGPLSYTYATGNVKATGANSYAGGICGVHDQSGGNGELSHNLALNTSVSTSGVSGVNIHRIAGIANASSQSNYATPDVNVNGQPVPNATPDSHDGANTSLEHFEDDLKNAPDNNNAWSTAWVFKPGCLPQLKKVTGDKNDPPTFEDWPNDKQTLRPASDYLKPFIWSDYAATSIVNAGSGTGGVNAPILIATAEELAYFAKQVNAGGTELAYGNGQKLTSKGGFTGCYFALSADIDLKGDNWEPIGKDRNSFKGHFDGKGYKVKGLKVKIENTSSTNVFAGLFGFVDSGTLQNLGVELSDAGIEVSSTLGNSFTGYAGGIVGSIGRGTLRNCYVEGTGAIKVTAIGSSNAYSGGIAGEADNLLTHCYATVDVEAEANIDCYAGGIVGQMYGTLSYTYATGNVKATKGHCKAGGICGRHDKSKNSGELSHNLALNTSVSTSGMSGVDIHRIAGIDNEPSQSNYAHPDMLLNGSRANSSDATSLDGADTYRETVRADLTGAATEWETVWDWTVYESDGKSPLLKQVEEAPDGTLTYGNPLGGQTLNDAFSSLPSNRPPTPPTPPEPTPEPAVFYTVTLPSVEGATTDPVAGTYEVESWSSFVFYLHLDQPNEQAQPIVTTDRGETLTPRTSDGAYVVKYVRSDITVMIDGIAVANDPVVAPATRIFTRDGRLFITADRPMQAQVVALDGRLVRSPSLPAGTTRIDGLSPGLYIVRLDNGMAEKVIVR